jgi:hypothetical protein
MPIYTGCITAALVTPTIGKISKLMAMSRQFAYPAFCKMRPRMSAITSSCGRGRGEFLLRQAYLQIPGLADLIEAHQDVVIEKEDRISQSRSRMTRSGCLIEELGRAKKYQFFN